MRKTSQLFKSMKKGVTNHSHEILACGAIITMISTVTLAVSATPKAMKMLEEAKEKKGEPLTVIEKVKTVWKPYAPAAISGTISALCVVGINSVHAKRNAALMTAYQLSTKALSDYREAAIETIGEKKESQIRDKIAQKQIEENPSAASSIIITGDGETNCYDPISGRYFKSDIDKIKNAVFDLNDRMQKGMEIYISLNEFYDAIGLPQLREIGETMGWNINRGYIDVKFGAQLNDKGQPCIVIDHLMPPEYGFNKVY